MVPGLALGSFDLWGRRLAFAAKLAAFVGLLCSQPYSLSCSQRRGSAPCFAGGELASRYSEHTPILHRSSAALLQLQMMSSQDGDQEVPGC